MSTSVLSSVIQRGISESLGLVTYLPPEGYGLGTSWAVSAVMDLHSGLLSAVPILHQVLVVINGYLNKALHHACGNTSFLTRHSEYCHMVRINPVLSLQLPRGWVLRKRRQHLERHPKPCMQHLNYYSVEILVVVPNLCPLPLYFYAGSFHDLLIPVSDSSLTADAFKVTDPRVSKSKVFNLLLISQLPK